MRSSSHEDVWTSSIIVLFWREESDVAVHLRPQLGSTGAEFQPSCFNSRVCAGSVREHKSIITFFGNLSHLCSVSPEASSPEKLMGR